MKIFNRFDNKLIFSSQGSGSGSNTPPCSLIPIQVHSAFQRQDTFFNYLVMCHDLWEMADATVIKGNHAGKNILFLHTGANRPFSKFLLQVKVPRYNHMILKKQIQGFI